MQANYYPTTVHSQRAPPNYDMNHLYLSPSQQQVNRQGIFHKRNEKIDWRRIAAVDVDRIAREMDFQSLQDNLDQITLCNIDAEVDTRTMDPNFIKLYKMAQLTIEYLLGCQEQITTQLADYEQLKNKDYHEHKDTHDQIKKLQEDLAETKKESKKRRKMLETQQRMLMAQNSNYHTCPVCTKAFLSATYLQTHQQRRHPDFDPSRRREHDVDTEKESQRLRDELRKKDNEMQLIKAQKTYDEEKIRDRETTIRQLKEDIQTLTTKITVLEDRYTFMRSNTQMPSPSTHRHETGNAELLKENKSLRDDNDRLKQLLEQADNNLKKEIKIKKRYEQDIENLKQQLNIFQNSSGDDSTKLARNYLTQLNEEKSRRENLQDELQQASNELAQYRNQPRPPSISHRESPVLPTRTTESPVPTQVQTRPTRPVQTTAVMLPEYCTRVIQRLKDNPKFLTKYRDDAKKQYKEELEEYESLGITETDTRLTELDFRTKMEGVLQTRRNIQNDLPNFESIRANISKTLDKLVKEKLDFRRSITSIRSIGSKVTFQDEPHRQKQPAPIYDYTKKTSPNQQHRIPPTTISSKPKHDYNRPTMNNESDDDVTLSNENDSIDDEDTQPTRPGITTNVQPSPRKNIPPPKTAGGISSLVTSNMRPSTASTTTTVSALVRQPVAKPTSTTNKFNSDTESESPVPPPATNGGYTSNITDKNRIIERKLQEANAKGQKPGINAIAQVFRPPQQSHANQSDDDDESESLTTLHTNPPAKPSNGHLSQLSSRELVNNNPLSSGDVSQHTYDSLWKIQANKGGDLRRPPTADSAKTSNLDSDDNIDGEESN